MKNSLLIITILFLAIIGCATEQEIKKDVKIMTPKQLAEKYLTQEKGIQTLQYVQTLKGNCTNCYAVDHYNNQTKEYVRTYIQNNKATNEELFTNLTSIKPIKLKII